MKPKSINNGFIIFTAISMFLAAMPTATFAAKQTGISLNKRAWTITGYKEDSNFNYLGASNIPLSNSSDGGLMFDFPGTTNAGFNTVNYFYTPYKTPMDGNKTITITLQVGTTGTPVFNYVTETGNTCINPAHARPYFASNGKNLGVEFGRWWSNPVAYELANGTATLTIPLTPDAWSSVYGKFGNQDATTTAMFLEALQTVTSVGLTFGGGCFFGHGVYVTGGTAQFKLSGYTIN